MKYSTWHRLGVILIVLSVVGCVIPRGIVFVDREAIQLHEQTEQRITFTVERKNAFSFDLHFEFKDSADRARVAALVGSLHYDKTDKPVRRGGVQTPVQLTVERADANGTKEVFRTHGDPLPTGFTAQTFMKTIGHVWLEPGAYVASLTPLGNIKNFEKTPVYLVVSYNSSISPK